MTALLTNANSINFKKAIGHKAQLLLSSDLFNIQIKGTINY